MIQFDVSDRALDPAELELALRSPGAGALVTFVGWVRDHSDEGGQRRSVGKLEYQVYEPLAVSEGTRVLEEAEQRFEIASARCVHRSGTLQIGDAAVWVGVTAAHRDGAFRACRYIIDEIKVRLPIWKRETYGDGDSGWVNCQLPERAVGAAEESAGDE